MIIAYALYKVYKYIRNLVQKMKPPVKVTGFVAPPQGPDHFLDDINGYGVSTRR